jgi:Brp/Blh family beta-carotene 15,15'-monooxygenase
VFTFFTLWITTQFDTSVENLLAYFLILSFGLLHGANDLILIQRTLHKKKPTFFKILSLYVLTVISCAIVFYFVPKVTLVAFILCSGYHFGEQHLITKVKGKGILMYSFFTTYGLLIFLLLFYSSHGDVSVVIRDMTGVFIKQVLFMNIFLITTAITLILGLALNYKKRISLNIAAELLYFVVFFVLFNTATLLWAFAIYFVIWHAIPSIKDQLKSLHGVLSKKAIYTYIKSSFLYWMFSVVGIAGLFFFTKDNVRLFNVLFFAMLAAITFPHIAVINKLNRTHIH